MEMMKCPHCGADIVAGSSFCQFCGGAVAQQSNTNPQQNAEQQPPYAEQQPPYGAPQQPPYGANQQPPYGAPQNPYGQPNMPVPPGYEQKSKIAAGILGILLGSLGIHNFYLGYTNKALIQLLVSLLTCGIGAIAMGIWGLIEGIQILTGSINVDAKGIPLKD